jgi:proprotein convertase subtilisin/kexin type 5
MNHACYKVRCDTTNQKYYVTVASVEKECTSGSTLTFTGYNGGVKCDTYEDLCSNLTCPHYCLKRGLCVHGSCQCNTGYGGDYCQTNCHLTCKNCSRADINQCTVCRRGETLSAGICSCPAGTTRNSSGKCVGSGSCNALCNTCTGTCSACITNAQFVSGSTTDCECNQGFTLSNRACVAVCQVLCKTCDPVNGASCLSCKDNATLSNLNCTCNDGFTYDSATFSCKASCNSLCKTCDVPEDAHPV